MGYATLGQMLQWIEKPSGKTIKDNRCELVELANRIRQHFYLLYETVPLYLDGEECFMVEEFPLDCNCKETFFGITLPDEYETVEAIWKNDIPIKMFDKWREYRDGIKSSCSACGWGMYDIVSFDYAIGNTSIRAGMVNDCLATGFIKPIQIFDIAQMFGVVEKTCSGQMPLKEFPAQI